jgi:hypothetical protein
MTRFLLFLPMFFAVAACSSHVCAVDCATSDLTITATGVTLIRAQSSCGQEVSCTTTSCSLLDMAPPEAGGACEITVDLSNGAEISQIADWGAPHMTDCCGMQFEHHPTIDINF